MTSTKNKSEGILIKSDVITSENTDYNIYLTDFNKRIQKLEKEIKELRENRKKKQKFFWDGFRNNLKSPNFFAIWFPALVVAIFSGFIYVGKLIIKDKRPILQIQEIEK